MKRIFIFRKAHAAVILLCCLMAFSSAMAETQCFTRNKQ